MDDTLGQIIALSDGLSYISETDAPFEPFQWQGSTLFSPDQLGAPLETVTVDHFFRNAVNPDLYGDDAARFQALVALMKTRLTNLQVYRVGTTNIRVYIIGQTAEGQTVGLTTNAVET
jgi:hypothetical protein